MGAQKCLILNNGVATAACAGCAGMHLRRLARDPTSGATEGGRRPENIVNVRRPPQGLSFWLGVILMALSFGIYPAYPVVPFLPISAWSMGEVAVGHHRPVRFWRCSEVAVEDRKS